jgi:acetolactate synthase-1/2/3 large subunit
MAAVDKSTPSCARVLLELLAEFGVDQVFGIPGNHTVALYRDFQTTGIKHITARHEQGAAFMADGYARATGMPGVCVLISGPGLLNAATAIAQAYADCVPMLVISGVARTADLGMGRGTLHELPDQQATAASFCRSSHTLLDVNNLPELLSRAFALFSSSRPGPVHIEIPLDLMDAPLQWRPQPVTQCFPPGPDPHAIAETARRLQQARSPLLVVGGGAQKAAAELVELAETVDVPVLNTVNGKGICPRGHPLAVGGSPSLPSLHQALRDADLVLAIGTELAETDYDLLMAGGLPDISTWIRMDIDPSRLLIPGSPALAITSDAALGCAALTQALKADDQDHSADKPGNGQQRAAELRQGVSQEEHYHPDISNFFAALYRAADDLILVGDSTRPTYYAAWQLETTAPARYFHSASGFGTLGYALPAALGAAAAGVGPVAALIGDGGLQFTLPELTTGAQARLPVPVLVWNNFGYAEIENSMSAQQVPVDSTRILTPDFRRAAAAHRCHYHQPADLDELTTSMQTAMQADAPTVIELLEADFISGASGGWY